MTDVDPTALAELEAATRRPVMMSANEQRKFIEDIGNFIMDQVRPVQARIKQLEAQVAELQAGGIRYCGVHQRANDYRRGSVVTAEGALWIATVDIPPGELPGKSLGWQLSVKSPRLPTHPRAHP
jgi:hypothetical protein